MSFLISSVIHQLLSSILREGNGNPLQCSCLENPVDRGAWWAAVHRVAQSWTRLKQLSMHACIGEGNGNPLQCSCLQNPRDRRAWWGAVQSQTRLKRLSSSSSILILLMFVIFFFFFTVFSCSYFLILECYPWTGKGGVLTMGSQRVRHNLTTEQQ